MKPLRQITEIVGHAGRHIVALNINKQTDEGKVNTISIAPDKVPAKYDDVKIKYWGGDNKLPQRRKALLQDNNIVGTLIQRKAQLLIGQGLTGMIEEVKDGDVQEKRIPLDQEVREWLDSNRIETEYCVQAATDWYMHAGFFVEIIREKEGDRKEVPGPIKTIRVVGAEYMRCAMKVDGKVPYYVYCSDWPYISAKSDGHEDIEVEIVEAYDSEKRQPKSMLYICDKTFTDGYYGHPTWWGGKEWIEVANKVPNFFVSMINNADSMLYLLKYPEGYFDDQVQMKEALRSGDQTKIDALLTESEARKKAYLQKFKDNMSGTDNAGTSIHTEKVWHEKSKSWQCIEIEVISSPDRGESLYQLWEKTNEANVAGQGLPPNLANIPQPGKLSAGNEIRNSYLYYIASATWVPRQQILSPIVLALRDRGYRMEGKLAFRNIILTPMSEDKSGAKSQADGEG